jgi:hypothetical protein
MNKKQLKRLTAPLTKSQLQRELNKMKLPRSAKAALFQARMAGGVQ